MKQLSRSLLVAFTLALAGAASAQAACVAEYKAKRENPFALFYEIAQISGPCTIANATAQLRAQLAAQGLTLLKVMSVRDG